jgi:hypothetical protein
MVLYWPTSTVGGDVCGKSGSTITPTPTIPGRANTALFSGQTLVSPSVYVILGPISARNLEGDRDHPECGRVLPGATLTFSPDHISYLHAMIPSYTSSGSFTSILYTYVSDKCSFNFEYLNTVPWTVVSHVNGLRLMGKGRTPTIPPDYTPILLLPTSAMGGGAIQSEFAECDRLVPIHDATFLPISGGTVATATQYGVNGKTISTTQQVISKPKSDFRTRASDGRVAETGMAYARLEQLPASIRTIPGQ